MIVNCPKCGTEFEKKGKWGTLKFCSRKCGNSRERSEETREKISCALKQFRSSANPEIFRAAQALSHSPEAQQKRRQTWRQKRIDRPFHELSFDLKRRIIIEEQNGCCNKCGISDWYGHKISLEIDHINGNNNDDSRDNLEALCPNCHSITPTWRGRNKTTLRVTDQQILDTYQQSDNIRQTLLKLGIAAKGNNYARVKNLVEKQNEGR